MQRSWHVHVVDCGSRRGGRLLGEKHHDVDVIAFHRDLDQAVVRIDPQVACIFYKVHIVPRRAEGAQVDALAIVVFAAQQRGHHGGISCGRRDDGLTPCREGGHRRRGGQHSLPELV